MEDKPMLMKSQMIELENNKIEHEWRHMELNRMTMKNRFLKLAIEHFDCMVKYQKGGIGSEWVIPHSSEIKETPILRGNQMRELEKSIIERGTKCMELHRLKLENQFLKLGLKHMECMLECLERGTDSELEISDSLEMDENLILISNDMLEVEMREMECEKKDLEVQALEMESEFLQYANEHIDCLIKCKKRGSASKL